MTKEYAKGTARTFAHLTRTRNIRILWMVRHLVHSIGSQVFLDKGPGADLAFIRQRLKLPVAPSEADAQGHFVRLRQTLKMMESRNGSIKIPGVLASNLEIMAKAFGFNRTECRILALAVLLRSDDDLMRIARTGQECVNPSILIGRVLGVPASKLALSVEPSGRLRKSRLVMTFPGESLWHAARLSNGDLRNLATKKIRSVDDLLISIVRAAPAASLAASDYVHLSPSISHVQSYLSDTLATRRKGVNVLLHGPPGTGKTELARVLAKRLKAPLYEVADRNNHSESLDPAERLTSAATGLFLLSGKRAILCFDEVDAIFNDGSSLFGKPSTAESQKSSFNSMLESNEVPMFWIANEIHGIDPPFARRFDMIINVESPPQRQRFDIIERELGRLVPHDLLRRLSQVENISPALVTRTARVVRHAKIKSKDTAGHFLESLLDGVLKAQGHSPLKVAMRTSADGGFLPHLCNASMDLNQLADGLLESKSGRICLYGPPGTGKTAFGHWLSDQVGRPLILKRISDIQSPWLGEMERTLADAFATATRDGAILQIDEVDSFLRDRRGAQRSWEISQINEFLTQLENFDGMFIASTNLMDKLDQAALRRFDFKVRMDFMTTDQAMVMLEITLRHFGFQGCFDRAHCEQKLRSTKLTPGDFSVIARRHKIAPFSDVREMLDALHQEASVVCRSAPRRIGFV